eukprot:10874618-Alexandrium_andersonii.AAC.1
MSALRHVLRQSACDRAFASASSRRKGFGDVSAVELGITIAGYARLAEYEKRLLMCIWGGHLDTRAHAQAGPRTE